MYFRSMKREYYLYRHVRLDKNEVFYIGIGTKPLKYPSYSVEFNRALKTQSRSKFWTNIFDKSKIRIEILFESDSLKEIFEKEAEFIKLYGRKDLNLGTLVNLTDGGEQGPIGYKWTEEMKKERSLKYSLNNPFKGKKHSEETKEKLREIRKGTRMGENNTFYGRKHSEETKKLIGMKNSKIVHFKPE